MEVRTLLSSPNNFFLQALVNLVQFAFSTAAGHELCKFCPGTRPSKSGFQGNWLSVGEHLWSSFFWSLVDPFVRLEANTFYARLSRPTGGFS